jgi:EamA-like transporter family
MLSEAPRCPSLHRVTRTKYEKGKQLSSVYPWLVMTTASIGVGVICLLPLALGEPWWQGLPHLHADGPVQLLYLGGVSSALGYGLLNYGLRFMDASQAAHPSTSADRQQKPPAFSGKTRGCESECFEGNETNDS